jgi:hypothetical protein
MTISALRTMAVVSLSVVHPSGGYVQLSGAVDQTDG